MKKFLLTLALICMVSLLGGCGAVDYQLIINSNGVITERIYLPVNYQYFYEQGFSEVEFALVRNQVVTLAKSEMNARKEQFNQKVDADDSILPENKELLKSRVEVKQYYNNEYVVLEFNYANSSVRTYFYNAEDAEPTEPKVENNFFTTKTTTSSKTVFASTVSGEPITSYMRTQFENIVHSVNPELTLPKTELTYTYVTPQSRLHSDADRIEMQDGYYMHIWDIEEDNLEREINLYVVNARTEVWYALLLGVSLLATGIMFLVYFIKKKKIKKNPFKKYKKEK